jgi:F0F1-type ATP synthase membrane subunit a
MSLFSFVFLGGIAVWAFGVVITKRAHSNTFQINYTLGLALIVFGAISYPFA